MPIMPDDPDNKEVRHKPFNAYRYPDSDKAKNLIRWLTHKIMAHEKALGYRKRQRQPAPQKKFEETVTAIICDMMYHHLCSPDEAISISRSHDVLCSGSRYIPPIYGKMMPDILDVMAEPALGFIKQDLGHQNPFRPFNPRTTIKAGKALIKHMREYGISLGDLTTCDQGEIILLKSTKDGFFDHKKLLEYEDTAQTIQYRTELKEINAWLKEADITCDPAITDKPDHQVDDRDRHMKRHFTNGSFDSGGRLFGGFWQPLNTQQRLDGIFIEEEDVAELDYSQMMPAIVYGLNNTVMPDHDAYILPGLDYGIHPKQFRKGIKKVFNAIMFKDYRPKRMPQKTRQYIPQRYTIHDILGAIEETHVPIKHEFYQNRGHYYQFHETQILIKLLLELKERSIVALPIHDAVIVAGSKQRKPGKL